MIEDDAERRGLEDLLSVEGTDILPGLCKSVSNQSIPSSNPAEMIRLVCLCGQSVYAVLNKKCVTKRLLMDYMSRIAISYGTGATKSDFIETILQTWKDKYRISPADPPQTQPNIVININNSVVYSTSRDTTPPLQQMAEEFVRWIFEKINGTTLQPDDVWRDITSCVRYIDSTGNVRDEETEGPESVYEQFYRLRNVLDFQLCPNLTASGVQGRMNAYGLVMVASCGIVTRLGQFVGLYEAAFGLMSESANIWKLKHSKILIRSSEKIEPSLEQCPTLKDILELPCADNTLD